MNHIATKAHIKKQLKIRSQISDHEQSKASPLRGNFLISPDIESDVGGCFPLIFWNPDNFNWYYERCRV